MSSQLDLLISEVNTDLGTPITKAMLIAALKDLATVTASDHMTRAECMNTTFVNPPATIRTTGYAAIGDGGSHLHKKVTSFTTPVNTLGQNVGGFTTLDGTKYQMVMEPEVQVSAFGATRMAGDSDFSVDSYQAFCDCRDWILSCAAGATNGTGITMRIDGYYYLTKAFHTGNGNYNIRGKSRDSRITTPWPYDQIVTHASDTFGREGYAYSSAFPVYLGQRYSVGNHIYVAVVAGTPSGSSAPSGTGMGQVDGTVVWNYEREKRYDEQQTGGFGGEISDLTVASNWGPYLARNSLESTKPSDDQTNLATEGAYFCGILNRTRCTIRNVGHFGQPGMGIGWAGSGDPYLRGAGNVDDFRTEHTQGGFCAWSGHHIGQMNANAGVMLDVDTVDCGAFGIANFCFLDNKFIGTQHDGDGQWFRGYSKYPTSCCHRGYNYLARLPILGVDNFPLYLNEEPGAAIVGARIPWIRYDGNGALNYATLTASISTTTLNVTAAAGTPLNVGSTIYDGGVSPGTKITALGTGTGGIGTYIINNSQSIASTTMHADVFNDANFAPWSPTQRYMCGGSYGSNNANDFSVIIGMYHESGTWPAQFGIRNIVIGSALTAYDTSRGATVLDKGIWQTAVKATAEFMSNTGRKYRTTQLGSVPFDGINSALADSTIWNFTDYDGTYYEFGSSMEFQGGTRGDRTLNNDFDFGPLNDTKFWRLSGKNTLRDYGRGVPFAYAMHIPNLILGDGVTGGNRLFKVTGIPTGGPYAVGDVAINMSGTVGQPKAWTCSAAPTTSTSTWTSWGAL